MDACPSRSAIISGIAVSLFGLSAAIALDVLAGSEPSPGAEGLLSVGVGLAGELTALALATAGWLVTLLGGRTCQGIGALSLIALALLSLFVQESLFFSLGTTALVACAMSTLGLSSWTHRKRRTRRQARRGRRG